mgnify:FL=1|tara:strand:- start:54 stop:1829 length:1776 start_codon:yes stop_codon:yes gene_type:complete
MLKIGKMRIIGFLLLSFVFSTEILISQVTFEAKLSKKKLGLNERLRIDFVMNENGDDFTPPDFKGFNVVGGPNQSVSNSWINGKRSFSKTYSYFLSPQLKGKIKILQATVKISGEIYKTSPLIVEVTSAVDKPNDPNNIDYIADENIHLVAEISNSNPYLNEGITILYKLYYRNPITISDVQELESPKFSDFWNHIIKIPKITVERGTYKNEPYNEVVWRKVVLYPQKTGKLVLEPLSLNLSVGIPTQKRDFFGSKIYRQVQKTTTTGKNIINVKALPEKNKPDNFTGAVGQFDFDVVLSKKSLKASESFQAKVKVNGKGNLKLFKLPKIVVPNTLELYEPEYKENIKVLLSGMKGSIEDSYTIVPQFQGKYPIPEISFSFFDPIKKEYKTLNSFELIVDVFDGPSNLNDYNKISRSEKKEFNNDNSFNFIELSTKFSSIKKEQFWNTSLFWLLFSLPLILIILLIIFKEVFLNRKENQKSLIQRRNEKLARKFLGSAKREINNYQNFYEVLERALHNYLKAKLLIETTEFSKNKIVNLLVKKNVDLIYANEYVDLLENCEIARFSKESNINTNSDYENAIKIISKIDKQL